ncbi:MAG TPA: DUF4401 domain-containing protein [Burkholderiales bacterium]|nr:DUF4401 domain-containing protein [Burkholderiales bacterium]
MNGADANAVWGRLRRAGLVEGDAPDKAETHTPWYIRTMLGVAGWIGAMFLLGFFLGAFSLVANSPIVALILGGALVTAAALVFRTWPAGDFAGQFGLAVSIAGQSLVVMGLGQLIPLSDALVALVFAVVQAGLFVLIPNFLHRVLVSASATAAGVYALGIWGFLPYTQPLVFAAFAWVWVHEFSYPRHGAQLRALGYGLTLLVIYGLVVYTATGAWRAMGIGGAIANPVGGAIAFWISNALTGAVMIWLVWKLLARQGVAVAEGAGLAALGGAVLAALIALKAPGLAITVAILLLGFANGNRVLFGLGVLSLPAYWSYYYYSLEITLLQKSALLACAGIALIGARMAVIRRWPAAAGREERDA